LALSFLWYSKMPSASLSPLNTSWTYPAALAASSTSLWAAAMSPASTAAMYSSSTPDAALIVMSKDAGTPAPSWLSKTTPSTSNGLSGSRSLGWDVSLVGIPILFDGACPKT